MPDHRGFNGHGRCTGACGDCVEIFVRLLEGAIDHAAFSFDGCAHTALAALASVELARGKPIEEALQINALRVLEVVGDVDEAHEHCAVIAVNALQEALSDALRSGREPWKQIYRNRPKTYLT